MCCQARWKREVVQDHKFDFVNVHEFHSDDWFTKIRYLWIYVLLLKSLAVYCLDMFTAITMLSTNHWTNAIYSKCGDDCVISIPFEVAKWIFVGCIIFSFVLLAYESWKAYKVTQTNDISYAYTNIMANDYYSLRDYDNFCFFCHISNSTKKKDDFAFFIFFTFKGWKRLLLADGPRQSINALTLYSFAYANNFQTSNLPAYWDNSLITLLLLLAMISTVLIFAGSMILLIAAAICYVPLLCYIQGNLKEYVCHKIDKRIAELIRRKQKQKVKRNMMIERELQQRGQYRDKNGKVIKTGPQPTLPSVDLDDDDVDSKKSGRTTPGYRAGTSRSPSERELMEKYDGYAPSASDNSMYPGPQPDVRSYSSASNDVYDTGYPPQGSVQSLPYMQHSHSYDADAYGSSVNLTQAAGPAGDPYPNQRMNSDQFYNYGYTHHRNGSKESYDSGRCQPGQPEYVQFQPYQPDYVDPNLPYHEPVVDHNYGHAAGAQAGRYDRHNSGGYGRY